MAPLEALGNRPVLWPLPAGIRPLRSKCAKSATSSGRGGGSDRPSRVRSCLSPDAQCVFAIRSPVFTWTPLDRLAVDLSRGWSGCGYRIGCDTRECFAVCARAAWGGGGRRCAEVAAVANRCGDTDERGRDLRPADPTERSALSARGAPLPSDRDGRGANGANAAIVGRSREEPRTQQPPDPRLAVWKSAPSRGSGRRCADAAAVAGRYRDPDGR